MAAALDSASLAALSEVNYTLSVEEDGQWKRIKALTIEDLKAFSQILERDRNYSITATREGYKEQNTAFDTYGMTGGTTKEVSLLLPKMTPSEVLKVGIDKFLPVPLYFDNDKPRGLADPSLTQFTYGELNQAYYERKPTFLDINTRGLTGEERTMAAGAIETFFEDDIRYAKESLDLFCERMLAYLNLGNTAEILIQGFASPLADYEYNLNLGRRRTSSIQNHISQWRDGALLPFVEDGSLKITFKSFGESAVKPGVSDNPTDIKNSIYSIDASRERRVQIIEVK